MQLYDVIRKHGLLGLPDLNPYSEVYYVDSDHANALDANDGEHGNTRELPFATVEYAITRNNAAFALDNDPQRLMLIHSKTYTESLSAFPKNCTVIGVGGKVRIQGYHSFSHAQNSKWYNVQFRSSEASVPIIHATGNCHGLEFHECVFDSQAAISECLKYSGNSSDLVVENCRIGYETNAANSPDIAIRFAGVAAQRGEVTNNRIFSTGIGIQIDAAMVSGNFLLIKDNVIGVGPGSADSQMAIGIYDKTSSPRGGLYVHNFISAVDAIKFDAANSKSQWISMGNWVNEGTTPAWEDGGTID